MALSLTISATSWARPDEICTETASLNQQACEIEQRALGCHDLAERAPEVRSQIRDCRLAHRPWTWGEVWRGCRDGFTGSWSDLYQALIASPIRFLQRSAHETETFLQNCLDTSGCREDLFRRAYGRAPSERDSRNLSSMRNPSDLFVLWRNAIARENSTGEQNRRFNEQLARTRQSNLESQPPAPQDASLDIPGIWRGILRGYENQMQRLRCFHTEAATELACYAIFSVVDPTLLAGGVAKLPRAVQAVRAARAGSGTALRTEAEVLDFLLNPPGARAAAAREVGDEVGDLVRSRLGPETRVLVSGGAPARGEAYIPSNITARSADDALIGQIRATYGVERNQLHIDFMFSGRTGEGVGQTLFEALLRRHPQTQRISTNLSLDNLHQLNTALARGLSCEDAIRTTPAYKIRARAGFAALEAVDCSAATFVVTR